MTPLNAKQRLALYKFAAADALRGNAQMTPELAKESHGSYGATLAERLKIVLSLVERELVVFDRSVGAHVLTAAGRAAINYLPQPKLQ